ncbi:MAG: hypothetical protein IT362_05205 [Deltaproteobacteria bacterium]|nr:hypothetical protein [Deltaproteobacteria bacterium]
MKRLFFASLILLAGCAGSIELTGQEPVHKNSVSYIIGVEYARNAGEVMAVEEDLFYYTATVTRSGYQPPPQFGSAYPAIVKGMEFVPHGKLWNGDTLLKSEGLRPLKSDGEPVSWEYCIAADITGRAYGDAACSLGITRKWVPRPENFLETKPVYKAGSSRKELIYGGMSEDTITIVYRESALDRPGEVFQQELAYDLSRSRTIRFRKMEIEVRVATSNHIRFIVRSGIDAMN